MKTAMQELRDDLIQIFNDNNIPIVLQIDKYLEKEKEQIIEFANCFYDDCITEGGSLKQSAEDYYNQTYDQKQHIIDIMKADEDDGLYDLNK